MSWTDTYTQSGYTFVENSDSWKSECSVLPCFSDLCWPDYDTKVIEDTVDGQPVVIQLWKGYCEQFLGMQDAPGGVGAEVGIYRRMPGRELKASLDFLPGPLRVIYEAVETAERSDLWWPYPELGTTLTFELTNPETGKTFFTAGPEKTYWLCKWMHPSSYHQYRRDQGGKVPFWSVDYMLKFTVNGKSYAW